MEETSFGRYQLQHLIGRGGMGEVWRAFDTETHRVVAIKLLPKQFATDAEFIERFRREARVAAGLNSPNVVPIHNFGEIDGSLYVDMQLVDGRDLEAVLEDGPMRPERAVRVIEQVAAALRTAHAAGLVHRDVKPSNILLNADDFAYLIDFGLARTDDDAGLTVTGHTVGTFAFMAPERYDNRPVDHRTDVYSLACVLFQCLTGRRPFPGTGAQQMLAHISTPPPRPSEFVPGLPRGFDNVVAIGMAKDPAARYPTIEQFARAARAALDEARGPGSYDMSYPPTNPGPPGARPPVTQAWQRPGQPSQSPMVGYPPATAAQSVGSVLPRAANTPRWRSRPVLIVGVCALVSVIAITATVLTMTGSSTPPPPVENATPADAVTVGDATYLPQTNVNSDGLFMIDAITTNPSGSIIGLCCMQQTFKISEGKAPSIAPLNLSAGVARSIAVDDQGNGYFAATDGRVLRLDGALNPTNLPFPPTDVGIAVGIDEAGDVFVLNQKTKAPGGIEVLKLPFGAQTAEVLPFDPTVAVKHMAVAPDGTVYIDNLNSGTILKLEPGSNRPTGIPFPNQEGSDAAVYPRGLAADGDGALYLAAEGAEGNLVYRYPPGENTAEALPIKDLQWDGGSVVGLAVDGDGNVYVVDQEVNRIVKLPRFNG